MITLENRVKNGVDWLNSVKPFWYREIDLCSMDIEKPDSCVIAQVFGSYTYIYEKGFIEKEIVDRGFTLGYFYKPEEEYVFLQQEWTKVISEMRNKDLA